jgi:hypothetical protein
MEEYLDMMHTEQIHGYLHQAHIIDVGKPESICKLVVIIYFKFKLLLILYFLIVVLFFLIRGNLTFLAKN